MNVPFCSSGENRWVRMGNSKGAGFVPQGNMRKCPFCVCWLASPSIYYIYIMIYIYIYIYIIY